MTSYYNVRHTNEQLGSARYSSIRGGPTAMPHPKWVGRCQNSVGLVSCSCDALFPCPSRICYVTASQVAVQSYYAQTSYTYLYDCSNFGWGWSYCAA